MALDRRTVLGLGVAALVSPADAWAQCRPTNAGLTVAQARSALLREARADIGRNVGEDCKNWMRTVVRRAVPGCMVPSTSPNADGYEWASSPGWAGMNAPLENLEAGQILQMRLHAPTRTPHTALVGGRNRSGLTLIHSNYHSRTRPNTVTEDTFAFADFYARLRDPANGGYRYSVYMLSFR
jgi:hypothetical protein